MYLAHFGLSESPFSLTPDPRYLYLGARHSEGLAHLLFGLSEAGGFVQLTGEIGTGKTTLCRTLLEQLPEAVDVAFILNPRVTDTELLATICTELGITHGPRSWSAAALVDRLHRYLLQAHEHARRTVLVIDEAQNLTNPVLEQVRLLTNLETTRDKLLQIILIGQPELLQLLARHDLRQVAQRITARYHLLPFSRYEAFDYIAHRMRLAGGDAEVFTYPARWVIFRAARGVPRLINVYCDRALLGAYVRERPRVTAGIARRAVREVEGGQLAALRRPRRRWMAAGALGLVLAALGWFYTPSPLLTSVIAGNRPAEPAIRPAPAVPQTAPQPGEDALKLRQFLTRLDTQGDETSALAQLFRRWAIEDASASSCAAAAAHSLACLSGQATWQAIQLLDLPVVLELRHTLGDARYATLTGRGEAGLELAIGAQTSVLSLEAVQAIWSGQYTVLWRPPQHGTALIRPGEYGAGVLWLRQRIEAIVGRTPSAADSAADPALYDAALEARVRRFQQERGLDADGLVGPETLLHLASGDMRGAPRLSSEEPSPRNLESAQGPRDEPAAPVPEHRKAP